MITNEDIELAIKIKIELREFLKARNANTIEDMISFIILKMAKLEKAIIDNADTKKE